jgi:hypothetical protein
MAAASGLVFALAAPGFAMQCPRGQFFWKSKNHCIDKAEAAKLGIYHGPIPQQEQPKAAPGDAAKDKPTPEPPTAETASPPAPEANSAPQQPAASEAPAMQPATTPSPYGALPTDAFGSSK